MSDQGLWDQVGRTNQEISNVYEHIDWLYKIIEDLAERLTILEEEGQ